MAKREKTNRPKARIPKGLRDITAREARAMQHMLGKIGAVYELYGFEPLQTPAFEYTDALGKFLPDEDRPNQGVFSFQDDDENWLSLRYDLTAPLARYVAENFDQLPKPFRRYQTGSVWRNEKPGPGRFREFTQFDADTVGTASLAADAELCMMAADVLEALGVGRGDYVVRVNNRKILDGVLETIGIDPAADETATQRLTILRAIDKLDRLGADGVALLLGPGRKDESGDFTKGAGLGDSEIECILAFLGAGGGTRAEVLARIKDTAGDSDTVHEAIAELAEIDALVSVGGYGEDRIVIDPAVVRGLEYYTGPVFEAELVFEAENEAGETQRFGSVGGGGRYDGLIARFRSEPVPATGFSIGVSRLYTALEALDKLDAARETGPVVVLVMDRDQIADYQRMTFELRKAGIRAEMYLGTSGMRAQMKYADRRSAPVVVIQGSEERERKEIMLKDLIEGERLSREIEDNAEWRESRPAQISIDEKDLVAEVTKMLGRYKGGGDD